MKMVKRETFLAFLDSIGHRYSISQETIHAEYTDSTRYCVKDIPVAHVFYGSRHKVYYIEEEFPCQQSH